MKKLLSIIPLCLLTCLLLLSNSTRNFEKFHKDSVDELSFSSNPNLGLTGAPGDANCTQCHSGTTQSANGNVDFTFSGASNSYVPNQTYTIDIGIPTNAENGFELTILDDNNAKAGTLISGVNSNIAVSGGKEYIRQTNKNSTWSFTWEAPSTDLGDLTIYYSFLKSNNNFSPGGDIVYLGQEVLNSIDVTSVSEYEKMNEKIKMFYNKTSNELTVNFKLKHKASIQVQVSDLGGKLIEKIDLGQKYLGSHNSTINLDHIKINGIYIVSLFVNNNVYNRKISF